MGSPLTRIHALGVLAPVPGLAALAPSPATALSRLATGVGLLGRDEVASTHTAIGHVTDTLGGAPADPTVLVLAAVALAAWTCTGWLLVVTALLLADRLPGRSGRAAREMSARVAPASLRLLIRVALGTSLAASVVIGPPALAAGRDPAPTPAAASTFDWPTTTTTTTTATTTTTTDGTTSVSPAHSPHGPGRLSSDTSPHGPGRLSSDTSPATSRPGSPPTSLPGRPLTTSRGTSAARGAGPAGPLTSAPGVERLGGAAPTGHGVAVPAQVVVAAGDSLWSLAAQALGPGATDRQVATAWPAWWSANRVAIGDDPDLIYPGTHLTVPPH